MRTRDILDCVPPLKRLALLSGIGAAGYLAYRMYAYGSTDVSAWRTWRISPSCSFLPTSWVEYLSSVRLVDPAAAARDEREAERELDEEKERVRNHFRATIEWADAFHFEMLAGVSASLFEADGLDTLQRALTAPGVNGQDTAEAMKLAAFTRYVVALWTLPATFVLCRLVFCIFGRLILMSKLAEAIHNARRNGLDEATPPPVFSEIYQRRLILNFRTTLQETVSTHLYRIVATVVERHVSDVTAGTLITYGQMSQILSSINSEIDAALKRQDGIWASLLGGNDRASRTAHPDSELEASFMEDILDEARRLTKLESFSMLVVEVVKDFAHRECGFMHNAYTTVMDEMREELGQHPSSGSESDEEEGTDVLENGSSAFRRRRPTDEGTVVYNDETGSERSDYSQTSTVYDAAGHRNYGSDPRLSPMSSNRLMAEPSLEPLDYSDIDEEFCDQGEAQQAFYSEEEEDGPPRWDGTQGSELDTGEHQSFDNNFAPAGYRRSREGATRTNRLDQQPLPKGIYFFRWATKLGRHGKEILTESKPFAKEFAHNKYVADFTNAWFAPESITSLARDRSQSVAHGRLRA